MTAVEKYIKTLKNYKEIGGSIDDAIMVAETLLITLEKKQMEQSFFGGVHSTGEGWNAEYANGNKPNVEMIFKEQFEEYYNEKFKTN
jgi:hypothetical protein